MRMKFVVVGLFAGLMQVLPAEPVDIAVPEAGARNTEVKFDPGTNQVTLATWVRFEVRPRVNGWTSPVLAAGNGWNCGAALYANSRNDGTFTASFGIGAIWGLKPSGRDNGAEKWKHPSAKAKNVPFPAGEWHHVAGTWDGAMLRIYVDGVESGTDSFHGDYVAKDADILRCGTQDYLGFQPMAHRAVKTRALNRVLTPAEIADLAKDRPNLPEATAFAAALNRADIGGESSAKALLALADAAALSPKGRAEMDGALAFGHLREGNLDEAKKCLARRVEFLRRTGRRACETDDLRFRFAEALLASGHADEGLGLMKEDWETAVREKREWAAAYGRTYAAALRRANRVAEAAAVDARIVETNVSPFFPQVNTELGAPATYTCVPAKGAQVSRAMPTTAFYVAPDGDDAADGTAAKPFRTLERARDAVRALKAQGLPAGGVAVHLKEGFYAVERPIELGEADSGERTKPVVWDAAPGAHVVLSGAWRVPELEKPGAKDAAVMARVPVAARGKVRVADVSAYPHAKEHYPRMFQRLYPNERYTDLLCNGRRLIPARYPNLEDGFIKVKDVGDKPPISQKRGYKLSHGPIYADIPDLDKWANEKEVSISGCYYVWWQHFQFTVEKIDAQAGSIDVREPFTDVCSRGVFWLENAPGALDAPGEWWMDREAGRLYVIPYEEKGLFKSLFGRKDAYSLSCLDGAIFKLTAAHDLRFEGLVLEGGRQSAFSIATAHDVVIGGNVIRNFSETGLVATNVTRLTVCDSVVRDFGFSAMRIYGGNRKTLTPSDNLIRNNEIARPNRRERIASAVYIGAMGGEISNNEVHDGLSMAFQIRGNDLWVVSNYVHDVVKECDDMGAVDIYLDPSYYGNRFCWNVWQDIGQHKMSPNYPPEAARGGVRFDDNVSGQTVYANRFINVGEGSFGAVQANGGRQIVVDNNIFVGCRRGMSMGFREFKYWQTKSLEECSNLVFNASYTRPGNEWYQFGVDIRRPPYATRYPALKDIFNWDQVNWLTRNVCVGGVPIVSEPPRATVCRCNRFFETMPDMGRLEREGGLAHVPTADEVGPRPTPAFLKAKENDR